MGFRQSKIYARLFATATTGTRVEIGDRTSSGHPDGEVRWYTDNPDETQPAAITAVSATPTTAQFAIRGFDIDGVDGPNIDLRTDTTDGGSIDLLSELLNIFSDAIISGQVLASEMRSEGARDDNNDTSAQTSSTTYVQLTGSAGPETACELTMPYPASGCVKVEISCDQANNTAAGLCFTSFEIRDTDAAGTQRVAALDANAILLQAAAVNGRGNYGRTVKITGLPTTGTLYARLMHRVGNAAHTGTFRRRNLIVTPEF